MTCTPPPTPIPPFVHHFRAADQKLILSKLETKKRGKSSIAGSSSCRISKPAGNYFVCAHKDIIFSLMPVKESA